MNALRISIGRDTTLIDINIFVEDLKSAVNEILK